VAFESSEEECCQEVTCGSNVPDCNQATKHILLVTCFYCNVLTDLSTFYEAQTSSTEERSTKRNGQFVKNLAENRNLGVPAKPRALFSEKTGKQTQLCNPAPQCRQKDESQHCHQKKGRRVMSSASFAQGSFTKTNQESSGSSTSSA
jgi:hypothetical protein